MIYVSSHKIRKTIAKLENRLDKTTSNYTKAQATLDEIHRLENELELRRTSR